MNRILTLLLLASTIANHAHAQASAAALAYAAAHQGASERMAAILLKQARWPG